MLNAIGDNQVMRAVGDLLFRKGTQDIDVNKAIQNAINAALPDSQKVNVDGRFGSQTLYKLGDVSNKIEGNRILLNSLGDFRNQESPHEKLRNDYYRFKE